MVLWARDKSFEFVRAIGKYFLHSIMGTTTVDYIVLRPRRSKVWGGKKNKRNCFLGCLVIIVHGTRG